MKRVLVAAAILVSCTTATAGWTGFVGFASGANDGAEVALGYRYEAKTRTSIAIHPLQAVFFEGELPDGYRKETTSDGRNICRDLSNGQFAKKSKCERPIDSEYTPSAELMQVIFSGLSLGVGYRGGDEPGAYGALQIRVLQNAYIGVRGGPEYIGGGVGFSF